MFPIILVFILRENVDQSDNLTSRRNMNSHNICTPGTAILIATKTWYAISDQQPTLPI